MDLNKIFAEWANKPLIPGSSPLLVGSAETRVGNKIVSFRMLKDGSIATKMTLPYEQRLQIVEAYLQKRALRKQINVALPRDNNNKTL